MAYRKRMTKKASRKNFKRGAIKTHKKNVNQGSVMRGGYRL